ncbi:unnamed protein product [Amoebophrya sp. A120]|nr:unnamed protein product [Amoebophrya sp. A120]|eukprot:GSA120T00024925001.1
MANSIHNAFNMDGKKHYQPAASYQAINTTTPALLANCGTRTTGGEGTVTAVEPNHLVPDSSSAPWKNGTGGGSASTTTTSAAGSQLLQAPGTTSAVVPAGGAVGVTTLLQAADHVATSSSTCFAKKMGTASAQPFAHSIETQLLSGAGSCASRGITVLGASSSSTSNGVGPSSAGCGSLAASTNSASGCATSSITTPTATGGGLAHPHHYSSSATTTASTPTVILTSSAHQQLEQAGIKKLAVGNSKILQALCSGSADKLDWSSKKNGGNHLHWESSSRAAGGNNKLTTSVRAPPPHQQWTLESFLGHWTCDRGNRISVRWNHQQGRDHHHQQSLKVNVDDNRFNLFLKKDPVVQNKFYCGHYTLDVRQSDLQNGVVVWIDDHKAGGSSSYNSCVKRWRRDGVVATGAPGGNQQQHQQSRSNDQNSVNQKNSSYHGQHQHHFHKTDTNTSSTTHRASPNSVVGKNYNNSSQQQLHRDQQRSGNGNSGSFAFTRGQGQAKRVYNNNNSNGRNGTSRSTTSHGNLYPNQHQNNYNRRNNGRGGGGRDSYRHNHAGTRGGQSFQQKNNYPKKNTTLNDRPTKSPVSSGVQELPPQKGEQPQKVEQAASSAQEDATTNKTPSSGAVVQHPFSTSTKENTSTAGDVNALPASSSCAPPPTASAGSGSATSAAVVGSCTPGTTSPAPAEQTEKQAILVPAGPKRTSAAPVARTYPPEAEMKTNTVKTPPSSTAEDEATEALRRDAATSTATSATKQDSTTSHPPPPASAFDVDTPSLLREPMLIHPPPGNKAASSCTGEIATEIGMTAGDHATSGTTSDQHDTAERPAAAAASRSSSRDRLKTVAASLRIDERSLNQHGQMNMEKVLDTTSSAPAPMGGAGEITTTSRDEEDDIDGVPIISENLNYIRGPAATPVPARPAAGADENQAKSLPCSNENLNLDNDTHQDLNRKQGFASSSSEDQDANAKVEHHVASLSCSLPAASSSSTASVTMKAEQEDADASKKPHPGELQETLVAADHDFCCNSTTVCGSPTLSASGVEVPPASSPQVGTWSDEGALVEQQPVDDVEKTAGKSSSAHDHNLVCDQHSADETSAVSSTTCEAAVAVEQVVPPSFDSSTRTGCESVLKQADESRASSRTSDKAEAKNTATTWLPPGSCGGLEQSAASSLPKNDFFPGNHDAPGAQNKYDQGMKMNLNVVKTESFSNIKPATSDADLWASAFCASPRNNKGSANNAQSSFASWTALGRQVGSGLTQAAREKERKNRENEARPGVEKNAVDTSCSGKAPPVVGSGSTTRKQAVAVTLREVPVAGTVVETALQAKGASQNEKAKQGSCLEKASEYFLEEAATSESNTATCAAATSREKANAAKAEEKNRKPCPDDDASASEKKNKLASISKVHDVRYDLVAHPGEVMTLGSGARPMVNTGARVEVEATAQQEMKAGAVPQENEQRQQSAPSEKVVNKDKVPPSTSAAEPGAGIISTEKCAATSCCAATRAPSTARSCSRNFKQRKRRPSKEKEAYFSREVEPSLVVDGQVAQAGNTRSQYEQMNNGSAKTRTSKSFNTKNHKTRTASGAESRASKKRKDDPEAKADASPLRLPNHEKYDTDEDSPLESSYYSSDDVEVDSFSSSAQRSRSWSSEYCSSRDDDGVVVEQASSSRVEKNQRLDSSPSGEDLRPRPATNFGEKSEQQRKHSDAHVEVGAAPHDLPSVGPSKEEDASKSKIQTEKIPIKSHQEQETEIQHSLRLPNLNGSDKRRRSVASSQREKEPILDSTREPPSSRQKDRIKLEPAPAHNVENEGGRRPASSDFEDNKGDEGRTKAERNKECGNQVERNHVQDLPASRPRRRGGRGGRGGAKNEGRHHEVRGHSRPREAGRSKNHHLHRGTRSDNRQRSAVCGAAKDEKHKNKLQVESRKTKTRYDDQDDLLLHPQRSWKLNEDQKTLMSTDKDHVVSSLRRTRRASRSRSGRRGDHRWSAGRGDSTGTKKRKARNALDLLQGTRAVAGAGGEELHKNRTTSSRVYKNSTRPKSRHFELEDRDEDSCEQRHLKPATSSCASKLDTPNNLKHRSKRSGRGGAQKSRKRTKDSASCSSDGESTPGYEDKRADVIDRRKKRKRSQRDGGSCKMIATSLDRRRKSSDQSSSLSSSRSRNEKSDILSSSEDEDYDVDDGRNKVASRKQGQVVDLKNKHEDRKRLAIKPVRKVKIIRAHDKQKREEKAEEDEDDASEKKQKHGLRGGKTKIKRAEQRQRVEDKSVNFGSIILKRNKNRNPTPPVVQLRKNKHTATPVGAGARDEERRRKRSRSTSSSAEDQDHHDAVGKQHSRGAVVVKRGPGNMIRSSDPPVLLEEVAEPKGPPQEKEKEDAEAVEVSPITPHEDSAQKRLRKAVSSDK